MLEALAKLPPWIGSVPAWGTLLIVLGWLGLQWLKNQPVISQQKIDERLNIKSGYVGRIVQLEGQLVEKEAKCDREIAALNELVAQLRQQVANEAMQRVQGEISLINTLIDVVEAPHLRTILAALEQRRLRLQAVQPTYIFHEQEQDNDEADNGGRSA